MSFLSGHLIDWLIRSNNVLIDGRNILRPETVESLMLAYRVTGDEQYREWGWQIFEAFNKHCRVSTGGYAGIEDVQKVPAKQVDRMETFWLGETLSKFQLELPLGPKRVPICRLVADPENTYICYLMIRIISLWTRMSSTPR